MVTITSQSLAIRPPLWVFFEIIKTLVITSKQKEWEVLGASGGPHFQAEGQISHTIKLIIFPIEAAIWLK